jgi:hypothetical protein
MSMAQMKSKETRREGQGEEGLDGAYDDDAGS